MQKSFHIVHVPIVSRLLTVIKLIVLMSCFVSLGGFSESKIKLFSIIPHAQAEVFKSHFVPWNEEILLKLPLQRIDFIRDDVAKNIQIAENKSKNQRKKRYKIKL